MALVNCPECGKPVSDQAFACPHCGKALAASRMFGYEYRSERTLFGVPLLHIATGRDPLTGRRRVARGIIAIGDIAVGVVAIAGMSFGGIAVGGCSVGLVSLGGLAIGLALALGGGAIGTVALGGGAIGLIAMGGGAIGYYAMGGGAWGVHVLSAEFQDPQALDFFRQWLGSWVDSRRQ
jgi:hypothetical protein